MELLNLPDDPRDGERFTPKEQAVAVWLSHTTILIGVIVIMLAGFDRLPSGWFLGGELAIWVVFVLLFVDLGELPKFVGRYFKTLGRLMGRAIDRAQDAGPPVAFAMAFVLQFAALTPLLIETGGPIDSPFGQLAIAFAVFTPLLANEQRTIGIALVGSIGYYWVMIETYGFGGSERPDIAVFGAVTTLILSLTVGLATLDRRDSGPESSTESDEDRDDPGIGPAQPEAG
jgi:hypothetical protein